MGGGFGRGGVLGCRFWERGGGGVWSGWWFWEHGGGALGCWFWERVGDFGSGGVGGVGTSSRVGSLPLPRIWSPPGVVPPADRQQDLGHALGRGLSLRPLRRPLHPQEAHGGRGQLRLQSLPLSLHPLSLLLFLLPALLAGRGGGGPGMESCSSGGGASGGGAV